MYYETSVLSYSMDTSMLPAIRDIFPMKISSIRVLCSGLLLCSTVASAYGRRCAYGDGCWPSESVWQSLNSSLSGSLIRSVPSAAVCHNDRYDAELCDIAGDNWANSTWRADRPGSYAAMLWELGDGECFIDSTGDAPCDQGLVPHFSAPVYDVEDVQTTVEFARKHDLYLTVTNTGHSHLGRSSGNGSFAIWTHNMKGKTWHDSFVPNGAPRRTPGIPAVTLQAGEQWFDVYQAAAEQGVIVVGGSARTVGAVGGYLTGGGHSPFSYFYGLAVDNLLEVNLVDAKGKARTLNQYTDPEYFYAVRGGGGNSWGVITSVTYKTHPNPANVQAVISEFNTTDNSSLNSVLEGGFQTIPRITDAGYTGYGTFGASRDFGNSTFQAIFIRPNGTNETFRQAFSPLMELADLPGVEGQVFPMQFPSWIEYGSAFLQDPNIATNIIDASRLLTQDVLLNRTSDLVQLLSDYPGYSAGFDFIGKVNPAERDNTAVHPVWKKSRALFSMAGNWEDDAAEEEKLETKRGLVEISGRLGEIVGEDGGTYINEANPYEPDWQNVFWGSNYEQLLEIKERVDPENLFVCNRCVGSDIVYEP